MNRNFQEKCDYRVGGLLRVRVPDRWKSDRGNEYSSFIQSITFQNINSQQTPSSQFTCFES